MSIPVDDFNSSMDVCSTLLFSRFLIPNSPIINLIFCMLCRPMFLRSCEILSELIVGFYDKHHLNRQLNLLQLLLCFLPLIEYFLTMALVVLRPSSKKKLEEGQIFLIGIRLSKTKVAVEQCLYIYIYIYIYISVCVCAYLVILLFIRYPNLPNLFQSRVIKLHVKSK